MQCTNCNGTGRIGDANTPADEGGPWSQCTEGCQGTGYVLCTGCGDPIEDHQTAVSDMLHPNNWYHHECADK